MHIGATRSHLIFMLLLNPLKPLLMFTWEDVEKCNRWKLECHCDLDSFIEQPSSWIFALYYPPLHHKKKQVIQWRDFCMVSFPKKTLSIRGCETELLVNAAGDTGAISTSFMRLAACRSFGDEAVTLSWSAFGSDIACGIDISVMSNQWLRLEHPELRGWTCQL